MALGLLGEGAECQGHSPAIDPSPAPRGLVRTGTQVHAEAHPAPSSGPIATSPVEVTPSPPAAAQASRPG